MLAKTRSGFKWATHGMTESGDDLPIVLWDHPPSREEVQKWYETNLPEEQFEWNISEVRYA